MNRLLLLVLLFVLNFSLLFSETLAIYTYEDSRQMPWDKTSLKEGITGSEEAIIYISEELANLGYQVTIFANPPKDSPFSKEEANPRYVPVNYDDGTYYDVGIAWRQPYSGLYYKPKAKKIYLWPHDIIVDSVPESSIQTFDDVLWISKWQREQWMCYSPAFGKFNNIFGNGINVELFGPIQKRKNPYSCIYASNYARGLEILLDIWPQIKAIFPKATLDIYYGWQHWGSLSPEKEAKMRRQIVELKDSAVVDHGLVGHDELHQKFSETSLWTYPCIIPEVFCITALKAQYAGAYPVILDSCALPETVRHGSRCYERKDYLTTLILAMLDIEQVSVEERNLMRDFIEEEYTWKIIAEKWDALFRADF